MLTDLEERCLTFLRNGSGLNERMLIRQQLIRDLEAKRDAGEPSAWQPIETLDRTSERFVNVKDIRDGTIGAGRANNIVLSIWTHWCEVPR